MQQYPILSQLFSTKSNTQHRFFSNLNCVSECYEIDNSNKLVLSDTYEKNNVIQLGQQYKVDIKFDWKNLEFQLYDLLCTLVSNLPSEELTVKTIFIKNSPSGSFVVLLSTNDKFKLMSPECKSKLNELVGNMGFESLFPQWENDLLLFIGNLHSSNTSEHLSHIQVKNVKLFENLMIGLSQYLNMPVDSLITSKLPFTDWIKKNFTELKQYQFKDDVNNPADFLGLFRNFMCDLYSEKTKTLYKFDTIENCNVFDVLKTLNRFVNAIAVWKTSIEIDNTLNPDQFVFKIKAIANSFNYDFLSIDYKDTQCSTFNKQICAILENHFSDLSLDFNFSVILEKHNGVYTNTIFIQCDDLLESSLITQYVNLNMSEKSLFKLMFSKLPLERQQMLLSHLNECFEQHFNCEYIKQFNKEDLENASYHSLLYFVELRNRVRRFCDISGKSIFANFMETKIVIGSETDYIELSIPIEDLIDKYGLKYQVASLLLVGKEYILYLSKEHLIEEVSISNGLPMLYELGI